MKLGILQLSHVIPSLFNIVDWLLLDQSDHFHHLQSILFCLWRLVNEYCSSNRCSISVWERLFSTLQQSDESIKYFWRFFQWWMMSCSPRIFVSLSKKSPVVDHCFVKNINRVLTLWGGMLTRRSLWGPQRRHNVWWIGVARSVWWIFIEQSLT